MFKGLILFVIFSGFNAYALSLHTISKKHLIGEDKFLEATFNLKTISYSHSYLEVKWGPKKEKAFRMVFIPESLKKIPLSADLLMVQTNLNQHIEPNNYDREVFYQLAHKVSQKESFPKQNALIEIFNKLSQESQSSYTPAPELLCNNKDNWVYGNYTVEGDKRYVLAPIGDEKTNCYGLCGSKCSDLTAKYVNTCLNHDICHRVEGKQLGPCKDEFYSASVSALTEKSCTVL